MALSEGCGAGDPAAPDASTNGSTSAPSATPIKFSTPALNPTPTVDSRADEARALLARQYEADQRTIEAIELHQRGRLEETIARYGEAIRLDPQTASAYVNRGNAYSDLGRYQRAIQDFDQAIRLNSRLTTTAAAPTLIWEKTSWRSTTMTWPSA